MDKKFVIKQNQRKQFLDITYIIMLSGAFLYFYNKDISEIKYINKIIGALELSLLV